MSENEKSMPGMDYSESSKPAAYNVPKPQTELPLNDKPVDKFTARRNAAGFNAEEIKLCNIMNTFNLMLLLQAMMRNPKGTRDEFEGEMNTTADKYERQLVEQHRAIVAAEVAKARLPAAAAAA